MWLGWCPEVLVLFLGAGSGKGGGGGSRGREAVGGGTHPFSSHEKTLRCRDFVSPGKGNILNLWSTSSFDRSFTEGKCRGKF